MSVLAMFSRIEYMTVLRKHRANATAKKIA